MGLNIYFHSPLFDHSLDHSGGLIKNISLSVTITFSGLSVVFTRDSAGLLFLGAGVVLLFSFIVPV